jgi:hypothetical protein
LHHLAALHQILWHNGSMVFACTISVLPLSHVVRCLDSLHVWLFDSDRVSDVSGARFSFVSGFLQLILVYARSRVIHRHFFAAWFIEHIHCGDALSDLIVYRVFIKAGLLGIRVENIDHIAVSLIDQNFGSVILQPFHKKNTTVHKRSLYHFCALLLGVLGCHDWFLN